MGKQMLRALLEQARSCGKLLDCRIPVSPKYEVGAVLRHFNDQQPVLFHQVQGYDMPIAGGMFANRELYYHALGIRPEQRFAHVMNAIAHPIAPVLLPTGPAQDNVVTENIDVLRMLPVPTTHAGDSAPFLTAGVLVVKDIDTGKTYTAVRRFQVNAGNRLNVLVSPASPLLANMLQRAAAEHKNVECAVVIDSDIPYLLASQIGSHYGQDKHAIYGALAGQPLETIRCRTVDVEVPAQSEIVLEGYIPAAELAPEGPFGELMGYYSAPTISNIMNITAVTYRNDPIFLYEYPCREGHLCNGFIREAETYACLKKTVDVQDVNITVGGGCRLHCAVSIRKHNPADGRAAGLAALGHNKDIKAVMVVDEDVDIFNYRDMEGALASRVQAGRDIVILPEMKGSALEPSTALRGCADKMLVDATKPLGEEAQAYAMVEIPGFPQGSLDIGKYFPELK